MADQKAQTPTPAVTADAMPDGITFVVPAGERFVDLKLRGGKDGAKRPYALIASAPFRKYANRAEADADTAYTAGTLVEGKASFLSKSLADALQAAVKEQAEKVGVPAARIARALFASGRITIPGTDEDISESAGFKALFGADDDDDDAPEGTTTTEGTAAPEGTAPEGTTEGTTEG